MVPGPVPDSLLLGGLPLSGSSLPLFPTAAFRFSRPLCRGSLASAVSLIRAPQPLQQGVGAPAPGMSLINSWSPWSQNLSSPKEKQKQTTGAGGMVDNKSHCNWGPLCSVLRPLPLRLPARSSAPRATASSPLKAFLDHALAPPPLTNFHCPQHRTHPCHLLH